jgi:hypothetical protein
MKFQKFKFKKSDLNLIPENERIFFIQALNLLTELNVLTKISCSYLNLENIDEEVAKKSIHCHQLFSTFITAGKLYEGWMILHRVYFGQSGVSNSIESHISDKGKECLDTIKRYFSKQNHLERIRNKFAFHSDSDEIKSQYNEFPDDEQFEIYWSEYTTNCFSTTYFDVLKAILSGIDTDEEVAINELLKNIREITLNFKEFIGEVVQFYVEKYLGKEQFVEVPELVNFYNSSIPYFVGSKSTNA